MKYTKTNDGTITVTMSPDEADIISVALMLNTGRSSRSGTKSSVMTMRAAEMSRLFANAAHDSATDNRIHILFNDLQKELEQADDDEGGNVMYRGLARLMDTMHHTYTDFKELSDEVARDLHA